MQTVWSDDSPIYYEHFYVFGGLFEFLVVAIKNFCEGKSDIFFSKCT